MKYFTILSLILIVGCKTSKVEPPKSRAHTHSVVSTVDTLRNQTCFYSTINYEGSAIIGEGSIIARCGCFFPGEEVNNDCLKSQ